MVFMVGTFALLSLALWFLSKKLAIDIQNILITAGVFIVVGYGFLTGFNRVKSHIMREPVDDELSRLIMVKSSSLSFYISLYLWLFIMYLSGKTKMETTALIGSGIIGMAVVFLLSWIGTKIYGMKDE